jgi:hypothetical protein
VRSQEQINLPRGFAGTPPTQEIGLFFRERNSMECSIVEASYGCIVDRLIAHYGEDAVFPDIVDIPPDVDLRRHLDQRYFRGPVLARMNR